MTNKEKLFSAIIDCEFGDLKKLYESKAISIEAVSDLIHLEHLLHTAAARNLNVKIEEDGTLIRSDYHINGDVDEEYVYLDLLKPLSEQSEEVYKKLSEIIC